MVVTLVSFLPVFNRTNSSHMRKKSFDFVRQRMLESIELCASDFNFLSFGILCKWIWSVSREWEAKLHRFIRANGIFLNYASFLLWFVPQFFVHIVWYTNAIEAFHWRCASTETAQILWFWFCNNTDRKWSLFLTIPGSLVSPNTVFDLFFSQLPYYSCFHWSEIAVFSWIIECLHFRCYFFSVVDVSEHARSFSIEFRRYLCKQFTCGVVELTWFHSSKYEFHFTLKLTL